jgi:hypothetical protein
VEAEPADPLTEVLATALDEDDLPEPHHEGQPPTPAALARPADPEPAAEPEAAAGSAPANEAPPAKQPSIAASLEVPPLEPTAPAADGEGGGGGEWEILTGKVRDWFSSGEASKLLDQVGGPLKAVAYLLGLLLLLRLYTSVVSTIDALPLISGLLELVGLIAFVRFALLRLVKSSEREKVVGSLKQRWNDFRGGI